jgi:thiosulfate/3-mercaptopyruvate sulfurtransferase
MRALVTTDWLALHLDDPGLRVVDVRWYLDPARRGIDAYRAGHVPSAVFLDVDRDLSAPGGGRGRARGRHPWPDGDQVARVMGAAGIGTGTQVVAYDDQAGAIAARLWYLLRAYGHDAVAVLDGGLAKWTAEGRPLETAVATPAPAAFTPQPREGWVVGKDEMERRPSGALVLDARAPDRYRGEAEPVDPRAGHIPGARSAPFAANLTGGPRPVFRPAGELRERYRALGAEGAEPIVYCGSGVTACHDLLALEVAGLKGRLYAGSWSEWSADPRLPVATGDAPGGGGGP